MRLQDSCCLIPTQEVWFINDKSGGIGRSISPGSQTPLWLRNRGKELKDRKDADTTTWQRRMGILSRITLINEILPHT
jgi:hypothetical protein